MNKNIFITAIATLSVLTGCINLYPEMQIEKTEIDYTYYDYGKNCVSLITNCPSQGSPKILVIPVWFSDSDSYLPSETYKNNVLEDINSVFFGTSEETGWHSVSSYYSLESRNQLNFTGTVSSEWFESTLPSSLVGTSVAYTMTIVLQATEWYFSTHPEEDRTSYDLDKDGYLDAVSFIYAAPDYQSLDDDSLTNLWAHTNWLSSYMQADVNAPNVGTYFWASYDFMYSQENALRRTGKNYHNGASIGFSSENPIDAHVFIHEFGHVLGLDDYYDVNQQYSPAGGFSMEDYNIGGHDPFSLMALGLADPYIPTETGSIKIGAFQTTQEFVLLTPQWNEFNSPFDEYLLLELYTPTGLNELDSHYSYKGIAPTGSTQTGIRVWHIDARLAQIIVNEDGTYALANELTSNPYPDGWNVYKAFPNTYYKEGGSSNAYASILGEDYSDFNTIQLIRNNRRATYRPTDTFDSSDLFRSGDTFSMSEFYPQFVNSSRLNSGKSLGWSFSVIISGHDENATATINLIKE